MKTFKEIAKNSSIICAYINTDVPSPEYAELVETVKATAADLNTPYTIYLKQSHTIAMDEWFGRLYEGVSFECSAHDSVLSIKEELSALYKNVIVVDSTHKTPLFESNMFVGVDSIPHKSRASQAIESKNYKEFVEVMGDCLNESDIRKLYTQFNPPTRYNDIAKKTSETREKFFNGQSFAIGSVVEDASGIYEVLSRGSNYLVLVDGNGQTSKKFPHAVTESTKELTLGGYFLGYQPSNEFMASTEIREAFDKAITLYESRKIDDGFAILKSIKIVESMLMGDLSNVGQLQFSLSKIDQIQEHAYITEMVDKSIASQLQAAKIIAGAIGASTSGNNPTTIVNQAIAMAKKKSNPEQIKILKAMLVTASTVGLKYDTAMLESVDDTVMMVHKHKMLLKEKPTKDVLAAHQDMRKIGVDYSARDVGGKREMIRDILSHNHGANNVKSYSKLKASIRKSMSEGAVDETTGYGTARALDHDFAHEGGVATPTAPKPSKYKLVHRKTNKVVSVHSSATDAVKARTQAKGTMDTHAIVKEDLTEVHQDPDYATERDVFGYDKLKKKLTQVTGIKNYGEQEPNKSIDLVDKDGTVVKPHHTKPGFSLNATTDTVRKMQIRKLKGE